MYALVTGAGGFLGSYIVQQLVARGDRVRALMRRRSADFARLGFDPKGVKVEIGDLRDPQCARAACAKVDAVFHVAGVAGIWGPWKHFYENNTLGTRNVIEACRMQRVSKLVYTSSPSVTFDGSPQCNVDESGPYATHWLCHYPHSKALAEADVLAANGPDLATCALRPHLIWGPRDQHLIPRLLKRARSGRLRRIGAGDNLIDMVYVENAAQAHLMAADRLLPGSPVAGRAYYISQGEPVNCWNWIDEILAMAGLPPIRQSLSYQAAWRLGAVCEGVYKALRIPVEPPMTRFLAAQLALPHYFDIRRARADFGYVPAISAAEGLARMSASGDLAATKPAVAKF